MLVYRPRGVRGKLPVIVSYHGGPAGVSTARWSAQIRFFTSLGYAYVEPNVRGSTGYGRAFEEGDNGRKRLDAFKDIETSARWVAAQPWADKDRLVVFGGSYGGYTTLIGADPPARPLAGGREPVRRGRRAHACSRRPPA